MLSRLATMTEDGLLSAAMTPTTLKKSRGDNDWTSGRVCFVLMLQLLLLWKHTGRQPSSALSGRNCSALARAVTGMAQSSEMTAPSFRPYGRRCSSFARLQPDQ